MSIPENPQDLSLPADSSAQSRVHAPPNPNGAPKQPRPEKQKNISTTSQSKAQKSLPAVQTASNTSSEQKLTGAEIKKRAKAEKAARRAAEKAPRGPDLVVVRDKNVPGETVGEGSGDLSKRSQTKSANSVKSVPIRSSEALHQGKGTEDKVVQEEKASKARMREENHVTIFSHLYKNSQSSSFLDTARDVHPAVLSLGLQIKNLVVCGSNARCVGMLLAFKKVIESYTTPPGHALSRHLTTVLNAQVAHLTRHSRPLSTSQGNAIRHLKLAVSRIDPSLPEVTAKSDLLHHIDSFIRERITVAGTVIAREASSEIRDGDVIMTYGKSSIVEKTLLEAHRSGKKFKVLVVDSRPLFEGRNLACALSAQGIRVEYALITTFSHQVKPVTKVLLGAHAMTSNGCLYSRVGTALVAMMAKRSNGGEQRLVIVLCETVKFTSRTPLDSIVGNEIADADLLVEADDSKLLSRTSIESDTLQPGTRKGTANPRANERMEDQEDIPKAKPGTLQGWKDVPKLQLLNVMFDVTPAMFLDMIVTEQGSLQPSSVSVMIAMEENKAR